MLIWLDAQQAVGLRNANGWLPQRIQCTPSPPWPAREPVLRSHLLYRQRLAQAPLHNELVQKRRGCLA